ncbi:MAG: hypothetical protein H7A46_09815 [Verrucomicrobiales bacterium]|nr:hypothetical protein [Verrucomicrobiales bacterium]
MLAAMVFLGVLIPVVIEGLGLASRAGEVAERKSIAAQLAANQLNELIVTGEWESGQNSGDFGLEWPGYSWQLQSSTWSVDTMTELDLIVTYQVQGRDYFVRLATLVDSSTTE